jgi:hypothetical protein
MRRLTAAVTWRELVVFYIVVAVAALLSVAWLARTPLFRAHLRGHGKDPGFESTRMEGRFPRNGGGYDYGDKRPLRDE